ncbi:MAG: four helix bundle protein [Crocinitomicaceae bacterium]
MFDFEKLDVYVKAKTYHKSVTTFLFSKKRDRVTDDQLRRASLSVMLNISEGNPYSPFPQQAQEKRYLFNNIRLILRKDLQNNYDQRNTCPCTDLCYYIEL